MIHFFQPLDLTVNGSAKQFMRNRFTEYYAGAIREQLESGKPLEDIDVDFACQLLNRFCYMADSYVQFTSQQTRV